MNLTLTKEAEDPVVSLGEARYHLRLSQTTEDENFFIEAAIKAAAMHAESITGRVFGGDVWSWEPCEVLETYTLPVTPVTQVVIYDISTDEELIVPERAYKFIPASLDPRGRPRFASVLPLEYVVEEGEGDMYSGSLRFEMTCGYPPKIKEEFIDPGTFPVLDTEKTGFDGQTLSLVFDRPLLLEDLTRCYFEVSYVDENGDRVVIPTELGLSVPIETNCIVLTFKEIFNIPDTVLRVSFLEGFLKDRFDNFVQPFTDASVGVTVTLDDLGEVLVKAPENPNPFESIITKIPTVPDAVKKWILVRLGTLYQQRSEIVVRAGSANNAFFPHSFIDALLDPYIVVGLS